MVSLGQSTEWCDSNSVLYLPAGVKHANVYPQPSTRVHIEMASGNAMSSPCALRHPIVHELSRAAVSAFDEADNLSELDLTISINDAIGLLGSNRKTARSLRGDHWLLQLRDFLHAHCVEPLDMRMLSRVAGHHPVHVSREFRACFGKTITDYVRQRRILLAAKLLRCTSEPLSAIALDCGFYDQSHFANAFRRTAGVSPSAFRGCRGRYALPLRESQGVRGRHPEELWEEISELEPEE